MNIIEILKAFLFGIVEGVTEWLPVSSTGHMILLNEIMPLRVSPAFYEVFEVVIQLGAIMAVVVLFWNQIWPFGKKENAHPLKETGVLSWVKWDKFVMWLKIALACLPAAVVGVLFDDVFNALFYNYVSVSIALIVFGVAFIIIENKRRDLKPRIRSLDALNWSTVLLIGVFQVIAAVFPGTSRSGATIVGALMLGVSRTVAAEFTFFLAIPVMFGASLLKLLKFEGAIVMNEFVLLTVGMLVAYVVSVLVIKFLMGYIRRHDFKVFGWYRIVLGLLVLIYFLIAG
ncbi:MAG: undecaprenyl-diphosphate phosphatase [Clostridiales bacterium]|nr:undecaprenyl-diphosphate phosphatase [Clostridiales bacterium]